MVSAAAVANFFIDAANKCGAEPMTNLRLQKLMYYAQAWNLIRNGNPLFDENIKAWELGPVVPSIYQKYKICGHNPIANADDSFDYSVFHETELSVLIDVFVGYGKYTTSQLVNMTHRPKGAWDRTEKNATISNECIRADFSGMKPLEGIADLVAKIPEEGFHDENGHLVLPADWED